MAKDALREVTDQRSFVIVYHDSLESDLLENIYEKMLFIALKKFAGEKKQCFPSISKLANTTGMSKRKVQSTLKSLEEKNVIKIDKRIKDNGGQTSNNYTIYDIPQLWKVKKEETESVVSEYEESRMIKLLESRGYNVTKRKELESVPTKAQNQAAKKNQYARNNNISNSHNCQERYSLDQVKELFGYETIKLYLPYSKELDDIINILYDVLNTTKPTIRVGKEEKPTKVVVSRLMELTSDHIIFAIDQYTKQTTKINNPESYILTILYKAVSQMDLSIRNSIEHNMYGQQDDDN